MIAQARARLGSLDGQVDELLRFREQLHRTARELEDEYSRVLARLGANAPTPAPAAEAFPPAPTPISAQPLPPPPVAPAGPLRAPIAAGAVDEAALLINHPAFAQPEQHLAAPAVEPPPAPAPPVAPMHQEMPAPPPPPAAAAPIPPAPIPPAPVAVAPVAPAPVAAAPVAAAPVAPAPLPAAPTVSLYEDTPFEGAIVLDAGPFTDIAALSTFEQGLARVPGAEDVYVSGFEGNRALVEMRLSAPIALVGEMRAVVPATFTVTDAAAGRLRLDVTAIAAGS